MMIRGLIVAAMLAACVAERAMAQAFCTSGKTLLDEARRRFGEQLVGAGQINGGAARLMVLASKSGGFTVATLDPRGNACVLFVGESWEQAPLPGGQASP